MIGAALVAVVLWCFESRREIIAMLFASICLNFALKLEASGHELTPSVLIAGAFFALGWVLSALTFRRKGGVK